MTEKKTSVTRSSFNAPTIGKAYPASWVKVTRKDGTVTFKPPKKRSKKK